MGVLEFRGVEFTRIVELTPSLRRRMEQTIDHLIALLDTYDGDTDAEENGDEEPSLGWTYFHDGRPRPPLGGDGSDWEAEPEHDEDGGDMEPVLGAPERHPASWEFAPFGVVCREPGPVRVVSEKSQECWADGAANTDEREEENEHGGDILDEPHDEQWVDDEEDYRHA